MMHDDAFPLVDDWIERLNAMLDADPLAAVVGGVEIRSAQALRKWNAEKDAYLERELGYETVTACMIPGAITMIDRKRTMDIRMREDWPVASDAPEWDYYFRVTKAGMKVQATRLVPIWHPCHDDLETGRGASFQLNGNGEVYSQGTKWHGFGSLRERGEDFSKARKFLSDEWPDWTLDCGVKGAGSVTKDGLLVEAKTVLL